MLVDASIFACAVFAYLYIWTILPNGFPPAGFDLPLASASVASAIAWIATSAAMKWANHSLERGAKTAFNLAIVVALITLLIASVLNVYALTGTNLQPDAHGYTATAYMLVTWQGVHTVLLVFMGAYSLARQIAGKLDAVRRNTFDNTRIMWYFSAVQALVALAIIHTPRFVS
jgi:cytochrome c oxidase subunit I+III